MLGFLIFSETPFIRFQKGTFMISNFDILFTLASLNTHLQLFRYDQY